MMYNDYGYSYGHAAGFGILGFVAHAVMSVLLIIFVFWFVRRFFLGRNSSQHFHHWRNRWAAGSGLDILNERYAKGEIDKAEYGERKKTLLGE